MLAPTLILAILARRGLLTDHGGAHSLWQTAAHTLGVLQLGAEPHEGLLLSISNDTSVKLWEQATGVVKKSLKNENRVRFNAMCINSFQQEVNSTPPPDIKIIFGMNL